MPPDIETLYSIYKFFGISLDEMYGVKSRSTTFTIASHFNSNEYTKDELEAIQQFAEFLKIRRKFK